MKKVKESKRKIGKGFSDLLDKLKSQKSVWSVPISGILTILSDKTERKWTDISSMDGAPAVSNKTSENRGRKISKNVIRMLHKSNVYTLYKHNSKSNKNKIRFDIYAYEKYICMATFDVKEKKFVKLSNINHDLTLKYMNTFASKVLTTYKI